GGAGGRARRRGGVEPDGWRPEIGVGHRTHDRSGDVVSDAGEEVEAGDDRAAAAALGAAKSVRMGRLKRGEAFGDEAVAGLAKIGFFVLGKSWNRRDEGRQEQRREDHARQHTCRRPSTTSGGGPGEAWVLRPRLT